MMRGWGKDIFSADRSDLVVARRFGWTARVGWLLFVGVLVVVGLMVQQDGRIFEDSWTFGKRFTSIGLDSFLYYSVDRMRDVTNFLNPYELS